jgi:hypothetical protein
MPGRAKTTIFGAVTDAVPPVIGSVGERPRRIPTELGSFIVTHETK